MGFGDFVGSVLSKDVNNASNQGAGFWNDVSREAGTQWDRVAGQKVSTKGGKERKNLGSGKGKGNSTPPTNPSVGLITEDSINPQIASFEPMYGPNLITSEKYEVDQSSQAAGSEGNASKKKKKEAGVQKYTIEGEEGYWSLFNAWSIMKWRGTPFHASSPAAEYYNKPSLFAGSDPENVLARNPTASKIIEYTKDKGGKAYQYEYADFALAKYYGRISNDYLLTLRRFPMPVEDDILHVRALDANGQPFDKVTPDMARAVTWMSESAGNKLEDILKFKVSTTWKDVESELQTINSSSGGAGGMLGSKIGGSSLLSGIYGAANGMNAVQTNNAKSGFDATKGTYPNHEFGPINVIKKVAVRQAGLDFSNDIKLKFEYDLRQIKGVNPRVAFLDLMANLLVLTYNNGNFWGGAVRYTGGSGKFNKPFGDINKIKSGDFGGFLSGLVGSAMKGIGNIASDIAQNGLMGSKLGNNLIGGSLMKMFNTPQGGEAVNAFLTGDATGQYHLTVGNPLNPIAVIGNLYCASADFQFSGELSYDGFPTQLSVEIELKHARPRDKSDIESMFNGGRGRLYLAPKGGVDVGEGGVSVSVYGNKDMKEGPNDIMKKMAQG
jgi:hypothetical protein